MSRHRSVFWSAYFVGLTTACCFWIVSPTGINENFWATDDGATIVHPTGTSNPALHNVTYSQTDGTPPSDPISESVMTHLDGPPSCAYGVPNTLDKGAQPMSFVPHIQGDSCIDRRIRYHDLAHSTATAATYDSIKQWTETCGRLPGSCGDFTDAYLAISNKQQNNNILEFRDWLKAVLYYNSSDCYFCSDVYDIEQTLEGYARPVQGEDFNGAVAVIDFLLNSPRCNTDSVGLQRERKLIRDEQIRRYDDSVHDRTLTPLDTTDPSLESLGLGLLNQSGVVTTHPTLHSLEILSLTASENPFRKSTDIEFELSRLDVAQVEVFDVLGRRIFSSDRKAFEQGPHTIPFVAGASESGTLYVRLSTALGDTRTMKLTQLR